VAEVELNISTNPLYCASRISPVSKTSILGIPDTSFTLKIVPAIESDIENNWPELPSKLKFPTVLEFKTRKTIVALVLVSAPVKRIVGSVLAPLFGVISMLRSDNGIIIVSYCIFIIQTYCGRR
jgi:hypothetical protein